MKSILYAVIAVLLTACTTTQYGIIAGGETEVIREVVEVPIYIEQEVEVPQEDDSIIWVDSFVQPRTTNGVDILWIIDTSGSMIAFNEQLMNGIAAMMTALPASGWRLAMMSSDPSKAATESQFPLVPGDTIDDAIEMYDIMGKGQREKGFDAAYNYIYNNSYSMTWMRSDAALLTVFVSDEEEQSTEYFPLVQDFNGWYATLRGGSAYVASINNYSPDVSLCPIPPSMIDVGDRYMEAVNYFGGAIVDICSEDWSPGVLDASSQLMPHDEWELTHTPVSDSIRVFIAGSPLEASQWSYSATDNIVYFNETPPGGALVELGYRYHQASDTGDTGV
tara:strand:+ start:223 stop:1227 length:1005 start_codon:yes stop_codon:yes gene_type:complete